MIKFKLLIAAVLGSILGYFLINLFIVTVNIPQYIGIETVVTIFHMIYNKLKASVVIA